MLVSIILAYTCGCGTTVEGALVKNLRVNKLSMRTTGQGIGFMPRACKACKKTLADTLPVAARITDDDLVKVNAYRERKGWPVLAVADVSRQLSLAVEPPEVEQ